MTPGEPSDDTSPDGAPAPRGARAAMTPAPSLELASRSPSLVRRIRERAPTYWSDFREDPSWLVMFILGRTLVGRRLSRPRAPAAPPEPAGPSLFAPSARAVLEALEREGLFRGLDLPAQTAAEILAFAQATGCFGNHDRANDRPPAEHLAARAATPVTSGHYFERAEACAALVRVRADPLLQAVARGYLGQSATCISSRLFWSFPLPPDAGGPAGAELAEMVHFDLDDWRMLKFFFYLTDVDAGAGPHLYVLGTHRRRSLRHQISPTVGRPLEEVLQCYGASRLVSVQGPAGTGFAEDPFGFHAGSLATRAPRLMLEIGFGVRPPGRRRYYGERVFSDDRRAVPSDPPSAAPRPN